jgi:hypothetical protein
MSAVFCEKCGYQLRQESFFCPRCGTRAEAATPIGSRESQPAHVVYTQPQTKSTGGAARGLIIALLLVLILIIPIFPRDRVVYVNGVTQTVMMSTSYNTSIQTYTISTSTQIGVYEGTLRYVLDQYYNHYYNQYYLNYYYPAYYVGYQNKTSRYTPYCYYIGYDDYYYCSYSYTYYYPYYAYYYYSPYYAYYYVPNYTNSYLSTVTIKPSDEVVRVQQTQEMNGLMTVTLTHFDGTSDTYRHVLQQSLVQSGEASVPAAGTVTNTITNSVVNPVTSAVECQSCMPQHVTDHVSLLQLLLRY